MKKRSGSTGHRDTAYEEPTCLWECGYRGVGESCRFGPTKRGKCQSGYECVPIRSDGTWTCGRSEVQGGPCDDGPQDTGECCRRLARCRPRRTIAGKRRFLIRIALYLSAATVLLGFWGPFANWLYNPGEVTASHASIGSDCSNCHAASLTSPQSWPALIAFMDVSMENSALCVDCHTWEESPYSDHTVAAAKLVRQTKSLPTHHDLACTVCHQEHKGSDADLSAIADQTCHSCHKQQFESFSEDHPAFSEYGMNRTRRIFFTHQKHIEDYFQRDEDSENAMSCNDCHSTDARSEAMLTAGYEVSCASCHDKDIRGEGQLDADVPFIVIPEIDLGTLQAQGFDAGEWPEDADGELGSFLKLLLKAEPGLSGHLERVEGLDLFDLSEASFEERSSVVEIMNGIRRLVYELTNEGQLALRERIKTVFGSDFSSSTLTGLAGQIPSEVIRSAQEEWFPNLMNQSPRAQLDLGELLDGDVDDLAIEGDAEAEEARVLEEELVEYGGWYRKDFAVLYRPGGHADSFLKEWITLKPDGELGLLGDRAPGRCGFCHNLASPKGKAIYWEAWSPEPKVRPFTHFNHGPHLSLFSGDSCGECHSYLTEGVTNLSEFKSFSNSDCSSCHSPDNAGEQCTVCHNYHVQF